MNILLLSELVDKDGTKIGGDYKIDQDNNMTASKLTTDDAVHMQRQGMSWYTNFGRTYYNEDDDTNEKAELPKKDKKKNKPKTKKKVVKKLKEKGKSKMDSLVEDIFTKKEFDKEFVQKRVKDLKLNGIPPLEVVRDTNPILIRKVNALKELIMKNDASGEEKAIILNFLLDMDMSDIPQDYKEELKKKIR